MRKSQQLVMQAELPWPSGPVENPLRIDPEGHPKVVGPSDLLPHHPKSNFDVIYMNFEKHFSDFFFVTSYSL